MTDEHHPDDVARAEEALRQMHAESETWTAYEWAARAARLGRERWKPPVDPDLLLARRATVEVLRERECGASASIIERGKGDHSPLVQAALRAIKITKGEAQ